MYNATNAATWLWAPQRFATRLRVLRRASIQRNDLFVNLSPLRPAYRLTVALLYATQRFVCYFASQRSALQHCSSPLYATPLYATQRFVCYFSHLRAPPLNATCLGAVRRTSPQLNDLFVTTPLHAARLLTGHHGSPPLTAPQFNSTICLSIYYRASTRLSATNRGATRLAATRSNSTQRTET